MAWPCSGRGRQPHLPTLSLRRQRDAGGRRDREAEGSRGVGDRPGHGVPAGQSALAEWNIEGNPIPQLEGDPRQGPRAKDDPVATAPVRFARDGVIPGDLGPLDRPPAFDAGRDDEVERIDAAPEHVEPDRLAVTDPLAPDLRDDLGLGSIRGRPDLDNEREELLPAFVGGPERRPVQVGGPRDRPGPVVGRGRGERAEGGALDQLRLDARRGQHGDPAAEARRLHRPDQGVAERPPRGGPHLPRLEGQAERARPPGLRREAHREHAALAPAARRGEVGRLDDIVRGERVDRDAFGQGEVEVEDAPGGRPEGEAGLRRGRAGRQGDGRAGPGLDAWQRRLDPEGQLERAVDDPVGEDRPRADSEVARQVVGRVDPLEPAQGLALDPDRPGARHRDGPADDRRLAREGAPDGDLRRRRRRDPPARDQGHDAGRSARAGGVCEGDRDGRRVAVAALLGGGARPSRSTSTRSSSSSL